MSADWRRVSLWLLAGAAIVALASVAAYGLVILYLRSTGQEVLI